MGRRKRLIEKVREGNRTTFYLNGKATAVVCTPEGAEDEFWTGREGTYICWQRKVKEPTDTMVLEVRACFAPRHTMVPAVSYDGNPWGKDHEYKGYEKDGIPYTFAWHRSAVRGASVSWNDEVGVALYGEDYCSGSLVYQGDKTIHRVIWPEVEEPQVLYSDCWGQPFRGEMEPRDTFRACLCIGRGEEAAKQMLCHAWQQSYERKRPEREAEEIWRLSADYAHRLYTEEADGFRAFSIGFTWDGEKWIKRPEMKYEIGWCGQNASLAVSLLYDYQMTGNKASLRIGTEVLDSWVNMARSSSGFLLTRYDPDNSLIDACNLGTAGEQLLEAWEQSRILGMEKRQWLDGAIEICDFVLERQLLDGRIGMSWYRDGSACELSGSAGAFLILPLAEAYRRLGEEKYHIAAVRAYSYYYREFINNSYGTSGALDTCCIDKESVIPLLKAGILLYETTGFDSYLDMAEEAAWYLSTWQWHHHVDFPEDTVLGKLHYDTFGGTAVSTSHHHMDPFALCYVPDLLRLAELTGKGQWRERALAIWNNGVQVISDGSLQIAPTGVRPAGSCDEGYIHTRWGMSPSEKRKNGEKRGWGGSFDVTQWLVAWPCAFRLEVLRKWGNWNLLDDKRGRQKGGLV